MDSPVKDTSSLDEYSYLKTGGFSSENFKLEVRNLPRFYGISEFKKLLNSKLDLKPVKIKPPHKKAAKYLYVCFPNDEEKTRALSVLNGYEWKGAKLNCKVANPNPDPLVKKRKMEATDVNSPKKIDSRSQEERLKDSATPYWNISYDEQLALKQKAMRDVLMKLGNELWTINRDLRDFIVDRRKVHDGLICEFDNIKRANKTEGYRNKCEFTIGLDGESGLPTVGFRLASYASGSTCVAPVDNLRHISNEMKRAVSFFQVYIRNSDLKIYSPEDHSGYWKQLTVRQSMDNGDLMFIVSICSQELTEEQLKDLKESLVNYISTDDAKIINIKSFYFINLPKRESFGSFTPITEHLYGETHIYDSILGLKFRISPQAFFQINTEAAGILYQSAIDLSNSQNTSTIIDICCGTGTIGLCFSKHCDQVLGLELIPQAVEDARVNAKLNNCENADFFAGKAEEILSPVIARSKNKDIIAIVDPPRSGLHMKAVVQLRRTSSIKKLVYISCDPSAAMKNFVDLGKAPSKTMHGDPFFLTKAIPVDMFPHTKHTEMVLLFERIQSKNETVTSEEVSNVDEICAESTEVDC